LVSQKYTIWQVQSRSSNYQWEGELRAEWEVDGDPISDDYTPDEITAEELFDLWVDKVKGKYANDLIPILWLVSCREQGKFEFMPFQHQDYELKENFLTHFSWPINKNTREKLNWLSLPVEDKLWNDKRCNKGGFIQQATGWKPGILQPYVYLGSLLQLR